MRDIAYWVIAMALLLFSSCVPDAEDPALVIARDGATSHSSVREWDFDPQRVSDAVDADLVLALCGPYSHLELFEDGTYACSPG